MKNFRVAEDFKPIPIRRDSGPIGGARFLLRTVGDLQLLTCTRFLEPNLASMEGDVLDVGCGEMPFQSLLNSKSRYTGIDVPLAGEFGMRRHPGIVNFDGRAIPFPDESFDNVLCTEVLEHAEDPAALVCEMKRVLRPGGRIVVTVPFSARVHHAPHDFHRFTSFGLVSLFADFTDVQIVERGNDIAVIANKLVVVCARQFRLRPFAALPQRLIFLLCIAPLTAIALGFAHLSLVFGGGSRMDPLGYGVVARKAV
jgi:SAM-dependent methyltransferase